MYTIFFIALMMLFSYFFVMVNAHYRLSVKTFDAKQAAERELAARFIRNALRQYDIRHSRPDLQLVAEFERLTDEQDELVERYLNAINHTDDSVIGEQNTVVSILR